MNSDFDCQICSQSFTSIIGFKKHLLFVRHRQKYHELYPKDGCFWDDTIPLIFLKDPRNDLSKPMLGLSQMTLCFCSNKSFFLCHVCEDKFPNGVVLKHLSDVDHFNSYFAFTDPNALTFPLGNDKPLKERIENEQKTKGAGKLQVLHLPEYLFRDCFYQNYSFVMSQLHKIKPLSYKLKDVTSQRMSVHTYKAHPNRKHPLLGLKFIIECSFFPRSHLRHYLCTLCRLPVPSKLIMAHLLSFDHNYTYLDKQHPSTLNKDDADAASLLSDFAKQAEELCGSDEFQQVTLRSKLIKDVLQKKFTNALMQIEFYAKKGPLTPTVKPGKKLIPTLSGNENVEPAVEEERRISEPVTLGNEPSAAPLHRFHCQNCSEDFETNEIYCSHLSTREHQENVMKTFGTVMDGKPGDGSKAHFQKFFTERSAAFVGSSLIVTVLSSERTEEPVHVCSACETVFSARDLSFHVNLDRHVVQTLLYLNPWKLPFAWKHKLPMSSLKSQAFAEERDLGPHKRFRILDVPPVLLTCPATITYTKVMENLDGHQSLLLNGVPPRETFNRLQDNGRFPILGWEFLVKYRLVASGWKYLCLLCECPLSSDDNSGHVFSWKHVVTFLEKLHPGSLDANRTDADLLLDFAQQAALIHGVSKPQEIDCDTCEDLDMSLSGKLRMLTEQKAKDGKGPLMPCLTPKMKLFPRRRPQTQEENVDSKTNESSGATKNESIPGTNALKPVDGQESNVPVEMSLKEIPPAPTEETEERAPPSPPEPTLMKEINTSQSSSSELLTTAPLKKKRSLSDTDTSDSKAASEERKRVRLSKMREANKVDDRKPCSSGDASESEPCHVSQLQSFIQRKDRPPVIGLSAVYECVCNGRPPIYVSNCCRLLFKEQHIIKHLSETSHYDSVLRRPSIKGNVTAWATKLTDLARDWEKNKGHGKLQVVEVTPEDYEKLNSPCVYVIAWKIVKAYLAKKMNKNRTPPDLYENSAQSVTTNKRETSQQSATKEAPDMQEESTLPDTLPKQNVDSAADVMLANNESAQKEITGSSSRQTNVPPAESAAKTSLFHKSKGNDLQLNVNAASQVKHDDLLLRDGSVTPTTPHIGIDQLVKVKCNEKRRTFCFACQTTLEGSSHLSSTTHQINCVKKKFPWWSMTSGEEELRNMVALIHDDEKASKVEAMKIDVTFDVYKELKRLPSDKAIDKVKGLLKTRSTKKLVERQPSPAISHASNTCDMSTTPTVSSGPCHVTNSDSGKENFQTSPQVTCSVQPVNKLPVSSSPNTSTVQKPMSKVAPRIIKGSTTDSPSNLSRILKVNNFSVIGIGLIWECRGVPSKRPTFYLCETCSLNFSLREICEHMVSTEHNFKYLMKKYPQFMHWVGEELLPDMSDELTNYIADLVKGREDSMDAQTVLLSEEYFELVRTAPFVEALNVVRQIKEEKKTTVLPVSVPSASEVEQSEEQTTQRVSDTSSALPDDTTQTEISLAENTGGKIQRTVSPHKDPIVGNMSDSCLRPSLTDTVTDLHDSPTPTVNFPKPPQSPCSPSSSSNFVESPKHEKQERSEADDKPRFAFTEPARDDAPAIVDATEETPSVTLRETSTDEELKESDAEQDAASTVQETSAAGPSLPEDPKSVEDVMRVESPNHHHSDVNEESTSLMASTLVDHNGNEGPAPDPEDKEALDKHYFLLLIDFLKETKKNKRSVSSIFEQCQTESPGNKEEQNKAQQRSGWNLEAPKTDTLSKSECAEQLSSRLTSGTRLTEDNAGTLFSVGTTSAVNDNVFDHNELTTPQSQGPFVQSKLQEPAEEPKAPKPLLKSHIQQKHIQTMIDNSVSHSQVLMQTSQTEIPVTQANCEYESAGLTSICQSSQQAPSKSSADVTLGIRDVDLRPGAVQVQTQQTHHQEKQERQNEQVQLQTQTQEPPTQCVSPQSRTQTELLQVPSLSTRRRPQRSRNFRRNDQSTNFQPNSTMGEYGPFAGAAYQWNVNTPNSPVFYGPRDFTFERPVLQQHTPQFYSSQWPLFPNAPHPEHSGWFSPNLQQIAQNYMTWANNVHSNLQTPSSDPNQPNLQFFPHRH